MTLSAGTRLGPYEIQAAIGAGGPASVRTRALEAVTNLMTGRPDDQQVAVFDHRYTTGSGKNQRTNMQTVVVLPSAKGSLPDLQTAPENPHYKIKVRT